MSTPQLTNRDILITGGAGFIGSHLATHLVEDNDVTVLDSLEGGARSNVPDAATFIEGDIRDSATLERATDGVDLIFHEAALVSVDQSIETPERSHEINLEATLSLLEAARSNDARVVLASSAAIYGHPDTIPIVESQQKQPTSPYGLEKLALDHYARLYHDLYGLETVSLRYFNVYGPGQVAGDYAGVISIFIEQALRDESITVHGDGEQTRDFVCIDDVVQANLLAATTDVVGEAFNVGTGESTSIRELATLVRECANTDAEIVHTDARTGDIDHSRADISNATHHLGYEPSVSFETGLEQTIEWYRSLEA